jgi:hypothetical protein
MQDQPGEDPFVRRLLPYIQAIHDEVDESDLCAMDHVVFEIHQLYAPSSGSTGLVTEIEARVLANQPAAEIAELTGLTEEMMELLEATKWDVRSRLSSKSLMRELAFPGISFGQSSISQVTKLMGYWGYLTNNDAKLVDAYLALDGGMSEASMTMLESMIDAFFTRKCLTTIIGNNPMVIGYNDTYRSLNERRSLKLQERKAAADLREGGGDTDKAYLGLLASVTMEIAKVAQPRAIELRPAKEIPSSLISIERQIESDVSGARQQLLAEKLASDAEGKKFK